MSNNELDDLFKDKLGSPNTPPSPQAWGKLESQLQQRRRKPMAIWWNTAAAVLLLGVITILIRPWEQHLAPTPVAYQEDSTYKDTTGQIKPEKQQDITAQNIDSASAGTTASDDGQKNSLAPKQNPATQNIAMAATEEKKKVSVLKAIPHTAPKANETREKHSPMTTKKNTSIVAQNSINDTPAVKNTPTETTLVAKENTKGSLDQANNTHSKQTIKNNTHKHIVLEYNLVAAAPAPKTNTPKPATPEKKKTLLAMAKEKSRKISLGSLREAKDNLLTFSKKEKK